MQVSVGSEIFEPASVIWALRSARPVRSIRRLPPLPLSLSSRPRTLSSVGALSTIGFGGAGGMGAIGPSGAPGSPSTPGTPGIGPGGAPKGPRCGTGTGCGGNDGCAGRSPNRRSKNPCAVASPVEPARAARTAARIGRRRDSCQLDSRTPGPLRARQPCRGRFPVARVRPACEPSSGQALIAGEIGREFGPPRLAAFAPPSYISAGRKVPSRLRFLGPDRGPASSVKTTPWAGLLRGSAVCLESEGSRHG